MTDPDILLTSRQAAEMAGGVCLMTLWRWARDARVRFPQPDRTICGRRYWHMSTVRRWLDTLDPAAIGGSRPPRRGATEPVAEVSITR